MLRLVHKRIAVMTTVFTMVVILLFPMLTLGDSPQGQDAEKKQEKFVNGHDARDGRRDGRGPALKIRFDDDDDDDREYRRRHDDDDDDVDDDDREYCRRYDRDDDRYEGRHHIRRRALIIGYRAGYEAGGRDRYYRRGFNYWRHDTYREATLGYRRYYGSLEAYRHSFREGFRRGYTEGYRGRYYSLR